MIAPLDIVIDEQEKTPWAWEPYLVATHVHSLVTADYALACDCERVKGRKKLAVRFAIERKSLDDFLGTISSGWERFERELDRMELFPSRIVIVEGNFEQCCFVEDRNGLEAPEHNHPCLTPQFVASRIATLALANVSVLFAGNAYLAAGIAYRIFAKRDEQCRLT